jgi:hypothetical protein
MKNRWDLIGCEPFSNIVGGLTQEQKHVIYENNYYELQKYKKLEEKLGCPLDVVVKAFQKYIGWTTDCDFGYDNIPDEFEKYQNDKKFMNLKYNEGLMYIAIQETLEDIELEKNRR